MSAAMLSAVRLIPRPLGRKGYRANPPRPRPLRVRTGIDPGRTPATASLLRFVHRGECISGTLGATDAEHYFKFQIDSAATLRLAFASTSSVVGLQLIRLPDDQANGTIHPAEVRASASNLVTNPVQLDPSLEPGEYLVCVYGLFGEPDDYVVELSLGSPSRSNEMLNGHQRRTCPGDREPTSLPTDSAIWPGPDGQPGPCSDGLERNHCVLAQAMAPVCAAR